MGVIEEILRIRDDASASLRRVNQEVSTLKSGVTASKKGVTDLAGALGFGDRAEKIGKLGSAVAELGPIGATAAAGVAVIGAEIAALYAGISIVQAVWKELDEAARAAEELAPKLQAVAGVQIVSDESLSAARGYVDAIDALKVASDGFSQVLLDAYAPGMQRAADITTGLALALLDVFNNMEKVGSRVGAITSGTTNAIGQIGGFMLGGVLGQAVGGLGGAEAIGGSGAADALADRGRAAALKLWSQELSAKIQADREKNKPKTGPTGRSGSGRRGPNLSTGGFVGELVDTSDVQDIAATTLTRVQQDMIAAMKSAAPPDTSAAMRQLGEQIAEFTYGAAADATTAAAKAQQRTANLNAAAGALGTANNVLSGGVGGVASAVSSAGPVGAVVGAVMQLGDTLRTLGQEGIQELIDSLLTLPVDVLEMLPSILTETIPNLLAQGIPDLIGGLVEAIPELVKVLLFEFVPALIQSLWDMITGIGERLIKAIVEAIKPGKRLTAEERSAARAQFAGGVDVFGGFMAMFRRRAGGDAYSDPPAAVGRPSSESTARTSGGRGGSEGHTHIHVGNLIGTDARAARELGRLIRTHRGTRGTGVVLE